MTKKLPVLTMTIDWDAAIRNGSAIWMQKEQLLAVRYARPGEEMLTGEVAKKGYVAINDARNLNDKPLYCMHEDEFRRTSRPCYAGMDETLDDTEVSYWYVENTPRRVYFVPARQGAFHLDAPAQWNVDKAAGEEHPGWNVDKIFSVETLDGRQLTGYPLVETEGGGAMYEKRCFEDGAYLVCWLPEPSNN